MCIAYAFLLGRMSGEPVLPCFCMPSLRLPTRCSGILPLRPRSLVGGQPSRSPGGSRNAVGDVSTSLRSAQHDSVVSRFHNGASLPGECCRCAVPPGSEALAGHRRIDRRQTAVRGGAACRFASMPVLPPPAAARQAATARRPVLLAHRTVARRAERRLWTLNREDEVPGVILRFVNRLSDLLFTMARGEMDKQGTEEERWQEFLYKKRK